jgi:hypothetical protein
VLPSPGYHAQLEGRHSGADQPGTSSNWGKLAQDKERWLPQMGTGELGPADDAVSSNGCGHSHLSTKMAPTSCLPWRAGGGRCVLGVSLEADRLAMPQPRSQHCSGAKVAVRGGGAQPAACRHSTRAPDDAPQCVASHQIATLNSLS